MKHKNNSGPAWGGQNWRPGKESGTWFRHSPEYGPIVHYGTHLVILQGKRKLSREEWLTIREKDKAEASRQILVEAEARKAIEMPKQRAERQAVIDKLILETKNVASSPDWRISHTTSVSYIDKDGIQTSPYEEGDRYSGYYFHNIKWSLYYKGVQVCTWESGCWRPVEISASDLTKLGIAVEQISSECLEHHMASEHAKDPVTVKVTPGLVEPKHWSEGSPCRYPLYITLVGVSYDYHYSLAKAGDNPVFKRIEGGDSQDSHVGWGWGND